MMRASDLIKATYDPGEVAEMLGITTRTVSNHAREGKIRSVRTDTNRIRIPREEVIELLKKYKLLMPDEEKRRDVIYARVSSGGQKKQGDLDRQIVDILEKAEAHNLDQPLTVTDVGSGLNPNRKGLLRVIHEAEAGKIKRIFITNKDRLTRFGYEYLKELFRILRVEIVPLEEKEDKSAQQELVDDMMSLLASFSGKMYRLRGNEKKKMRDMIDKIAETEDSEDHEGSD